MDGAVERGGVVAYCGAARGQAGPYVTIPARGAAGSPWSPHQLGPLSPRPPTIYSWPGRAVPGDRNKLIHTSAHPVGLT